MSAEVISLDRSPFSRADHQYLARLTDALARAFLITDADYIRAEGGPGAEYLALTFSGADTAGLVVERHADGSYWLLLADGVTPLKSGRSVEAVTEQWAPLL